LLTILDTFLISSFSGYNRRIHCVYIDLIYFFNIGFVGFKILLATGDIKIHCSISRIKIKKIGNLFSRIFVHIYYKFIVTIYIRLKYFEKIVPYLKT